VFVDMISLLPAIVLLLTSHIVVQGEHILPDLVQGVLGQKVVLGCSQALPDDEVSCASVCHWTGPPPLSCSLVASLQGAEVLQDHHEVNGSFRRTGADEGNDNSSVSFQRGDIESEEENSCSAGLTALYEDRCSFEKDVNRETSDGGDRRKKRESHSQKSKVREKIFKKCCCTLTIAKAGKDHAGDWLCQFRRNYSNQTLVALEQTKTSSLSLPTRGGWYQLVLLIMSGLVGLLLIVVILGTLIATCPWQSLHNSRKTPGTDNMSNKGSYEKNKKAHLSFEDQRSRLEGKATVTEEDQKEGMRIFQPRVCHL